MGTKYPQAQVLPREQAGSCCSRDNQETVPAWACGRDLGCLQGGRGEAGLASLGPQGPTAVPWLPCVVCFVTGGLRIDSPKSCGQLAFLLGREAAPSWVGPGAPAGGRVAGLGIPGPCPASLAMLLLRAASPGRKS